MLGVLLGNHAGSTVMLSNPAMMTNTKDYLDINIISGDLFVFNDFIYVPSSDYNIWDALKGKTLPQYGENNSNFLYYKNQDLKNTAVNLRIMGPSAMIQLGDHAFGLSTGFRVFTTGNNIPWEMPVFGYEGMKSENLQNIKFNDYNIDYQVNAWGEIGFSYAYNLIKYFDQQLTVGVSVKYLLGYSGAYADIDNIDYIVQNDSTINITNLKAEIGYALPVDYNTNDFPDSGPTIKGSGLGLDLGVVYIKRKYIGDKNWRRACEQRYEDYKYRIGISILDIGRIKYKHNAQVHNYNDVNALWVNYDTISFDNLNQVTEELSNLFYGDPDASKTQTTMKIGLPTALSVQIDYNFGRNIYFGGYWIHPVRFNGHTLRRPAQLSFIPRYETKYLEFSLPLSLYEYTQPRVGASIRFYFLTVGTERLGTWLGLGNLDGMDLYFSIRFNLGKGSCKPISHNKCYNNEYKYSDKQRKLFRK